MPASDLRALLRSMRGAVRENVSLASYMHLRVGGPADWFLEPFGEEDVALCTFVDPCKIDVGAIVRQGLDMYEKES